MKNTLSRVRTGSEYLPAALAATGTASGLVVSYVPGLRERMVTGRSTCLFRRLTGLKCPFCGMTHAVVAVDHGHFLLAARQNAIVFLLIIACLTAAVGLFGRGRRLRDWFRMKLPRLNSKSGLCVALAYSVIRDL